MIPYQIIIKKRDKQKLSKEEIWNLVEGYTKGEIPDYQMSAFLMAVVLNGMDEKETFYLTEAMLHSGKILNLDFISQPKVDKHSTGGVGDKVSLILAPLIGACGICVPMISGRGLGHTGGTLDKLESIPGFRTDLTIEEFTKNLSEIGLSITGQTEEIAPADKKNYALRDVTGTVESIPLITASILSKKLASGTDAIVFDVKTGNGAFMQTEKQSLTLAKSLVSVCKKFQKISKALITDMNEPSGEAIGNALEIIESLEALKGNIQPDLAEVVFASGSWMLVLGKKAKNYAQGLEMIQDVWKKKAGLEKFQAMVQKQNGNPEVVNNYALLPQAKLKLGVKSQKSGYIQKIETRRLGEIAILLKAGRQKKEDKIDFATGLKIKKKIGDYIDKNQILAEVYTNSEFGIEEILDETKNCFLISKNKIKKRKKVLRML